MKHIILMLNGNFLPPNGNTCTYTFTVTYTNTDKILSLNLSHSKFLDDSSL